MAEPLGSPVVLDGRVTDEKLNELLALGTEYPELDYKSTIDLGDTKDVLELVRDIDAMEVRGGYIIYGVDGSGQPTGSLDGRANLGRDLDEARLAPKLRKWLPEPLTIATRVAELKGHVIAVVYVARHPQGCAILKKDGTYREGGEDKHLFQAGDVFWRDGTRTVRLSQAGLTEVINNQVEAAKADWIAEQGRIRQREQAEYRAAAQGGGPLGSVNLDMEPASLNLAALELVRRSDPIALRRLFNEALSRARSLVGRSGVDAELAHLLDELACLAATFLMYEVEEWFGEAVETLVKIYSVPLQPGDAERFAYSTGISPAEPGPKVWLEIIERVYSLGALAVRVERWQAIRVLTLKVPKGLLDYDKNWLRHALTMASRARHLGEEEPSLLSRANSDTARLDCLRADGIASDDDETMTSLAQCDILSNIVAIDGADALGGGVFFPHFARLQPRRSLPIVERLLDDRAMHDALVKRDDGFLAFAIDAVGKAAQQVGFALDGFHGWSQPIATFIAEHLPADPPVDRLE
jgi:hypothetical protein